MRASRTRGEVPVRRWRCPDIVNPTYVVDVPVRTMVMRVEESRGTLILTERGPTLT
jgi:hypothetical protein